MREGKDPAPPEPGAGADLRMNAELFGRTLAGAARSASSRQPVLRLALPLAAPDSEDYGASEGYPIGDRSILSRIPFLVGSYSHLDQIFEGRLIRRATTPSRLRAISGAFLSVKPAR
jgi:hypothetical protein